MGRYRLCLKLASGGMGTVYLACVDGRAGVHRFVALKCLRPELASDPYFVEMFLDEARISSQVHHPNVCSVIDFDEQDGVSYMAMEYLMGRSLNAVHKQLAPALDRIPPAHHGGLVARIIADASEGLHAAHELKDAAGEPARVVHRDVSPENLFLTHEGNVKVIDFGIALASNQRHTTRAGELKGKYSYLPPEVLRGQRPDRRGDVWGLGVVMWELLTGKRLFDFDADVDVLRAVTEMEIPPPSFVRQGLPAELDTIVLNVLERDPEKRYQTTRELGRQLTRLLAEHRLAIGLAELSDLMGQLFPNGLAVDRGLLETVERMEPGGEDDAADPMGSITRALTVAGEPDVHDLVDDSVVIGPHSWLPRRRWGRVLVALCSLAAFGVATFFLLSWGTAASSQARHAPQVESAPHGPPTENRYVFDVTPVESTGEGVLLRVRVVAEQGATPPVTIPVPNVVGRSARKAKEILSQAGVTFGAVHFRSNDDRRDGIVLEQTPAAGQHVVKGSKIDLAVNRLDERLPELHRVDGAAATLDDNSVGD